MRTRRCRDPTGQLRRGGRRAVAAATDRDLDQAASGVARRRSGPPSAPSTKAPRGCSSSSDITSASATLTTGPRSRSSSRPGCAASTRRPPRPAAAASSSAPLAQMAAAGRYLVPPRRRRRLLGARPLTIRRVTALWDEFDVLMTPALASAPIAAEGGYGRGAPVAVDIAARMTPYTSVFNLTGQPAVTVPIGVDGEGLPIACSSSVGWAPRTSCTRWPASSSEPRHGHSAVPVSRSASRSGNGRSPQHSSGITAALALVGALTALVFALAARPRPPPAPRRSGCANPGVKPDPCTPGLSTTVYSSTLKPLRVTHPKPAAKPTFDCFYVYPTVSDQTTVLSNRQIDPEQRSIALYQAARYSQYCRVFAPMYRQVTLTALDSGNTESPAQLKIPVDDVAAAFKLYLRKYNHGRPFVLIGHSQGSFVLEQMIRKLIDPNRGAARPDAVGDPAGRQRARQGWRGCRGYVQAHPRLPDDLRPRLRDRVLVVRPTGAAQQPVRPHDGPRRARAVRQPGRAAGSVAARRSDPAIGAVRARDADRGGTPAGRDHAAPAADRVVEPARLLRAPAARMPAARMCCRSRALHGAQVPKPSPDPTWGLHLLDANVELGNLVSVVDAQANNWARPEVRPHERARTVRRRG